MRIHRDCRERGMGEKVRMLTHLHLPADPPESRVDALTPASFKAH